MYNFSLPVQAAEAVAEQNVALLQSSDHPMHALVNPYFGQIGAAAAPVR
jgi:hypothetical protein